MSNLPSFLRHPFPLPQTIKSTTLPPPSCSVHPVPSSATYALLPLSFFFMPTLQFNYSFSLPQNAPSYIILTSSRLIEPSPLYYASLACLPFSYTHHNPMSRAFPLPRLAASHLTQPSFRSLQPGSLSGIYAYVMASCSSLTHPHPVSCFPHLAQPCSTTALFALSFPLSSSRDRMEVVLRLK